MDNISEISINSYLHSAIQVIVNGVLSQLNNKPQAIYLVGGYGRGEGAWYKDENGLHPYNDFDLAVITDTPLSHEKTEILRKELAKKVGIKWVDIDYYSLETLASLTPTIHNVDLLEGGSLIYGDDIIRKKGLKLDARDIGRQDLITLYRTRMWTFLGSWEGDFHDLSIEEARFFKNQMAKAMLAANDMRLVKLKKYTTSYRKRADIILNVFKDDVSILNLTTWAIKEKMRPSYSNMSKPEMISLYFAVKDDFLKAFVYSFGKKANYFLNPDKTKNYYFWHTRYYLGYFKAKLLGRKSSVICSQDIFYAMNYVFHANNNGYINVQKLKNASDLLKKYGYIKQDNTSWDELRLLTANARNNV